MEGRRRRLNRRKTYHPNVRRIRKSKYRLLLWSKWFFFAISIDIGYKYLICLVSTIILVLFGSNLIEIISKMFSYVYFWIASISRLLLTETFHRLSIGILGLHRIFLVNILWITMASNVPGEPSQKDLFLYKDKTYCLSYIHLEPHLYPCGKKNNLFFEKWVYFSSKILNFFE